MIFDHKVKVNGVYYDTGVDVPVSGNPVTKTETKIEAPIKDAEPTLLEIVNNTNNVMKLKKIAKDNGIEVVGNSASEVKEQIIAKL